MTIDNAKIDSHSSGGSSTSGTPMSSSSSGGSSSASSRMGSKRSNAGGSLSNNNNNNGELDLENLEYPDSPTSHKWFADNSDLSPLTVLDNINLKTEFPYSTGKLCFIKTGATGLYLKKFTNMIQILKIGSICN